MENQWLPVPGFAGYVINRQGLVQSLRKKYQSPRYLTVFEDDYGTPCVKLTRDGRQLKRMVHKLVEQVFGHVREARLGDSK